MRAAIKAVLEGDGTLAGLLTGGVWAGTEISRQLTAGAFDDDGEVLPCALVRLETGTPWGPYPSSGRLYVVVMFYERCGYEVIDAALERTYVLLHRSKVGGAGVWEVTHADDVRDVEDGALGCSMGYSRYVVTRNRG